MTAIDNRLAALETANAELHRQLARCRAELAEARDQQAATAEVLQVINSSLGNLAPVFDAVLEKAVGLCEAAFGSMLLYDGQQFSTVAVRGVPAVFADYVKSERPMHGPGTGPARILAGERVVHVVDLAAEEPYRAGDPQRRALVDLGGARSLVCVPLLKDNVVLGAIAVYRQEVRPFSDKQIALLRNFAAQAVIAMENARLLTETREALEQQTATAEVLRVINSSPGDLAPVFDTMVERAARLCEADEAALRTFDGELLHLVCAYGSDPDTVARLRKLGPTRAFGLYEPFARGERVVHIADVRETDIFRDDPVVRQRLDLRGIRTWLAVALQKEGVLLGVINVHRHAIRPFTDKQIALLENFAAQAVIAMENARLLTETREALAQQTATAEVLQVINSSPGDLAPVFEAMLHKAHTLCEASFGALMTYDGERFHAVAHQGTPPPFREFLAAGIRPGSGDPFARMVEGAALSHIHDLSEVAAQYPDQALPRSAVELGGIRSLLVVPLRKDNSLLGAITAYRQEVRPFTAKQIALLQNFAAQAVIAMENARLLTETREALEQQTATAEVLQVINSSPGDLAPVFDAVLENAVRICEASFGSLYLREADAFRAAAMHNAPPAFVEARRRAPVRPPPDSPLGRAAATKRAVQVADITTNRSYSEGHPFVVAAVDLGGYRTVLSVPLLKDNELVGAININRQEVRPFTDKQIALVRNFAAQAVIAIENARLLTETREALAQQTATAEVLQVINSSPGDLAPVFDAILDKARAVCGFAQGSLNIYDGDYFRTVATHGVPEAFAALLRLPRRTGPQARFLQGDRIVHLADIAAEAPAADDPVYRAAIEAGIRTVLFVPLRREQRLLGYITANRREVRPFTEKEIALLENFAAQAVIAMENARLLTETREALEFQTATSDVLKVISSAAFELQPVLETVVATAVRLCRADQAVIYRLADGEYRWAAGNSLLPEYEALEREVRIRPGTGTLIGRAALEARTVHILDAWTDPLYEAKGDARVGDIHTMLGVPLLRDGTPIGVIGLARRRIEAYSEREITLVRTFADQAVIAVENTRLLTETREALEQQTATAEVLGVINSSPGDLAPVFQALLDKALALCGAAFGVLWTCDGEYLHATALHGVQAAFAEFLTRTPHPIGSQNAHGRLLSGEPVVHVVDLQADDAHRDGDPIRRALVELGGGRVLLAVPLRKDDAFLGIFTIYRQEPQPFSDKQIALLQSFAAQAVIAMDNARLLDEIRQRQAELRVTFDNMGDGVAMFDAEHRLAAWNTNFQQILDLPDDFLTARPSFAEYFGYLARRGEYAATGLEGELSGRIEETERELRFERTRPDGRVVEVRRNPVPGGGFVLIYSDITERKRAEAEIAAARDAAEKALGELKTAQASLIHAEKMASLGQLTAGIAHEIKNPLNFVNNFSGVSIELLDELKEAAAPAVAALGDNERAEIDELVATLSGNLDKIAEHGRRADGIVTSMLAHSRGTTGERQRVDLNALVEEALNLAYHGARAQDQGFDIAMERAFEPALAPIEIVPQDVTRVFLNLFGNGFYAARKRAREQNGGFRPVLRVTTRELGDMVEIRVRDNGAGIPREHRDKLFQPFFTTKPTGEGTGLGLSICWDVVAQQHGGTIAVDSAPGEFAEFTIRLPRRAAIGNLAGERPEAVLR